MPISCIAAMIVAGTVASGQPSARVICPSVCNPCDVPSVVPRRFGVGASTLRTLTLDGAVQNGIIVAPRDSWRLGYSGSALSESYGASKSGFASGQSPLPLAQFVVVPELACASVPWQLCSPYTRIPNVRAGGSLTWGSGGFSLEAFQCIVSGSYVAGPTEPLAFNFENGAAAVSGKFIAQVQGDGSGLPIQLTISGTLQQTFDATPIGDPVSSSQTIDDMGRRSLTAIRVTDANENVILQRVEASYGVATVAPDGQTVTLISQSQGWTNQAPNPVQTGALTVLLNDGQEYTIENISQAVRTNDWRAIADMNGDSVIDHVVDRDAFPADCDINSIQFRVVADLNNDFVINLQDYVLFDSLPVSDLNPPCRADRDSNGVVDNDDLVSFIDAFFALSRSADIGSQGGSATPDGAHDNNDFIVFINWIFSSACE